MIRGKCPSCGARYFGWALVHSCEHYCTHCSSRLEIFFDDIPEADESYFSVFDSFLLSLHQEKPDKTDPQKQ